MWKHRAIKKIGYSVTPLLNKMSLRLVYTAPFIVQFLVAALIIIVVLFYGGQQSVNIILQQNRHDVLEHIHQQLEIRMKEPIMLNQLNANAIQAGLLVFDKTSTLDRSFSTNISGFPDVAMTFVGLPNRDFYGARRKVTGEIQVAHNNQETRGASWYYTVSEQGEALTKQEVFENFDARTRPWYQAAVRMGVPTFSSVYPHFVFREPTITAAYPIYYADGQLKGVLGVDFLLSWLGTALRSFPVGPSGQIFITDLQGNIIAASSLQNAFEEKNGQLRLINAAESDDGKLKMAFMTAGLNNSTNVNEFNFENKLYSIDSKTFEQNGLRWNIYVVQCADDYLFNLKMTAWRTIFFTLVVTIIVFGVTFLITRWVISPILRLNEAAKQLAAGHFQLVPDIHRKDELGQLSNSFNKMGQELQETNVMLEQRVKARTKELEEALAEVQSLSVHDQLTQIYNRVHFEAECKKIQALQMMPVGVIVCDVDGLKIVNDSLGHKAGDQLIKAAADCIVKTFPAQATVARIGGDEFAVLLPGSELAEIDMYLERLVATVIEYNRNNLGSDLSLSAGGAMATTSPYQIEDIFIEADNAMYAQKESKRVGRGR